MPRLYRDLRGRLMAESIDWPYLAKYLNIFTATLTRSMTGHRQWGDEEEYKILDLIKEPYENRHIIFPRGGIKS